MKLPISMGLQKHGWSQNGVVICFPEGLENTPFNVLKSASILGALDTKELGKPNFSFSSILNIIHASLKISSDWWFSPENWGGRTLG